MWREVSSIFQRKKYLSLSSGIWYNPKLLVGKNPVRWREWVSKGVHTLGDFYEEGILKSIDNLVEDFSLADN